MPIFSYLAHPKPGRGRALAKALARIPGCEVSPSSDYSVLVLVTDTADDPSEKILQKTLNDLADLNGLAMVFAHEDDEVPRENEP